jgi:hypothetical protein
VKSFAILAAAAIGGLATASSAELVALPDAGWQAAWAFRDTCLKSRSAGVDAAVAAILSQPQATEAGSLPAYGGGRPMRTFVDGKREYLIRYGKGKKFGCFVAFGGSAELSDSAKHAILSFDGLTVKTVKPSKKIYFEWTVNGSKDEIRLTPDSDRGTILINLEVL